jgi:glycosyl transferase family 87
MISQADEPSILRLPRRLCMALWLALTGITFAAFLQSLGDVRESPGTDLRARVVGAREMMLGLDPYFIPAKTNQIDALQDPDRYAAVCTRCTYSPALLCLYVPLANLPYQTQRYIWFGIEWLCLIASIAILRGLLRGRLLKNTFTAVALLFFVDSVFWRIHVERGQYYIFIVLLFCSTARLILGRGNNDEDPDGRDRWWAGIPLGIAAALRLTPLAAVLPLWILGYRRTAIGAGVAACLCLAATLPIGGVKLWESYFRCVSIHSRLILDKDFLKSEKAKLPPLPDHAEGMTYHKMLNAPDVNLTFAAEVLQPLSHEFSWMPGMGRWETISRIGAILVAILFPLMLSRRSTLQPAEKIAAAFVCVLLVDFFLPIRNSYADITLLVPLALFMSWMLRQEGGYVWFAVVILGLAMCHSLLPVTGSIPMFRPVVVMGGFLAYLAMRIFQPLKPVEPLLSNADQPELIHASPFTAAR